MLIAFRTLMMAAIFAISPATPVDEAVGYADSISEVTQDIDQGLELVTVLKHESDFRREVQTCRVKGDGGLALGSYQLHKHWRAGYPESRLCSDLVLQTRLADRALRACRGEKGSHRRAFARFLGRPENDPEVARRVATFQRAKTAVVAAGEVRNG